MPLVKNYKMKNKDKKYNIPIYLADYISSVDPT